MSGKIVLQGGERNFLNMIYVLMAIAGIWMADGLALLVAPGRVMSLLRASLTTSPTLIKWSSLAAVLGTILILGSEGLPYQPVWVITGLAMIGKGIFLLWAPDPLRQAVVKWCLGREPIDYRFWGLGLCALSILLLDALGWLKSQ